MHISIVTLFPELYEPFLRTSLIGRAVQKGVIDIAVENLFSLAEPSRDNPQLTGRIDSPTFGHGAGMLIKPELVQKAVDLTEEKRGKAYKIFFSPQGKKLDQRVVEELAKIFQEQKHIMLLPARYEGMDARVEEHYADCLISIGDYVLMGGDLPAMVLIEGITRLLPGVVGKEESIREESFSGPFVDYPEYTAPVEWKGLTVPDVIRSGNHAQIKAWRMQQAIQKTVIHHFDWLRAHVRNKDDVKRASRFIPHHYAVLMHDQVLLEGNESAQARLLRSIFMI